MQQSDKNHATHTHTRTNHRVGAEIVGGGRVGGVGWMVAVVTFARALKEGGIVASGGGGGRCVLIVFVCIAFGFFLLVFV